MKKLLYIALLAAIVVACSQVNPADKAALAAKQYYDYLLEGKYEAFIEGHYMPDSIPQSYRQGLVTNAKMFVGQQQREHRGIKETRVVNAEADTALHTANVFLVFTYGDSTSEEVNIPMIESKGIWYLR